MNKPNRPRRASPSTPPTTPPAIAPTLVDGFLLPPPGLLVGEELTVPDLVVVVTLAVFVVAKLAVVLEAPLGELSGESIAQGTSKA